MAENALVSIVVPFYNVEPYFKVCLESICKQTLRNIEIILVDDCSQDNSLAIAEKFAQEDTRIKILRNARNIGLGLSRNQGLQQATGTYIAFVDSDDWIAPTMYDDLISLSEAGSLDVICSDFTYVFSDGRSEVNTISSMNEHVRDNRFILRSLLDSFGAYFAPNTVCNKLYRKDFLSCNNILFLSERDCFLEDLVFNTQVFSLTNKFIWSPVSYYNYRIRSGSTMRSYRPDFLHRFLRMHELLYQSLFKTGYLDERNQKLLDKMKFDYTFVLVSNALKKPSGVIDKLHEVFTVLNNQSLVANMKLFTYKDIKRSRRSFKSKVLAGAIYSFVRYYNTKGRK